MSTINLGYLVIYNPYIDKKTGFIEIFNEFCVYIAVFVHACFLYETAHEPLPYTWKL